MISSACNAWISNSDTFLFFMRFALQKHTTPPSMDRPSHLDLMLQSRQQESADDRCLLTFEIPLEALYWGGLELRRLPPHRYLYLDYSGPIEGDRGTVERIDSGDLEWLSQNEEELVFRLSLANPAYAKNSGIWRLSVIANSETWLAEHLAPAT